MPKKKWTVDELTRMAFVCAEDDRREYADCDQGPAGKEALELAEAMCAYRTKRWGKIRGEVDFEDATLVEVSSTRFPPLGSDKPA